LKFQKEEESEKAPIWSVLRDDFMMGDGKLKDWDKEAENEQDSEGDESFDEDSS